jgi:YD repeat-containing protein
VVYGYDAQGRLASVTQVKLNGQAVAATGTDYDANGGIITGYNGDSATTLYTYDPAGNLICESDPNGMTTIYTYDDLNRLTNETVRQGPSTTLFTQAYAYYDNGQRKDEIDTRYNSIGSTTSQIEYQWIYDNENRLTGESLTVLSGSGAGVPAAYDDQFTYDLDNNRTKETITGSTNSWNNGTVVYTYNHDDQLLTETGAYSNPTQDYQTFYSYDASGNLQSKIPIDANGNPQEDFYSYDLQNHMTVDTQYTYMYLYSVTNYVYDYAGTLQSESTTYADTGNGDYNVPDNSTSIAYLNDPYNPTGYTKAIEEQITTTTASEDGMSYTVQNSTRDYVLGLSVVAQSDSVNGMAYLLTDGHGSTRALVNTSGSVVSGQVFDYDAFGTALDFNAATADTTWLFGGDGFYDPGSGWTYQLARWRNGFWFTQADGGGYGTNSDPISLHKYLYAGADPVTNIDPSGHDFDLSGFIPGFDAIFAALDTWGNGGSTPAWNPFQNPPPFVLTLVPIAGPLLQAAYDFSHGNTRGGFLNVGFAAFDAFGGALVETVGDGIRIGGTFVNSIVGKRYALVPAWKGLSEAEHLSWIKTSIKDYYDWYRYNGGARLATVPLNSVFDARCTRSLKAILVTVNADGGTVLEELLHAAQFIRDGTWGSQVAITDYERAKYEADVAIWLSEDFGLKLK